MFTHKYICNACWGQVTFQSVSAVSPLAGKPAVHSDIQSGQVHPGWNFIPGGVTGRYDNCSGTLVYQRICLGEDIINGDEPQRPRPRKPAAQVSLECSRRPDAHKNQAWLVTGASGYLGAELCKKIKSKLRHVHLIGTDARSPEHNWFDDFIPGSLDRANNEVVQRIRSNNVDLVIHLAGVAVEGWCFDHPFETCESNIRSVYILLEAIRQCSSRCSFILSTTDKVYGRDATDADPYREDQPLIAKNIYETSKVCADLIAQSYWLTYQVPVAIVRFSNIYGGLDHNSSRLFPCVLERLHAGDAPELRLSAAGAEYTRDFIHFSDVAEGLILVAEALLNSRSDVVGEIFNISSGDERRVRDVLEEIIAVCRPGAEYVEVKGGVKYLEIINQCASNEKISRTLGWSPKVSLTDGIRMIRNAMTASRTPLSV